jgi:hypothetical protein
MAHQRCRTPQTRAIFVYQSVAYGLFPKKKPQQLLRPLESHTRASAKRQKIIVTLRMIVGTLPYSLLAHSEENAATAEEQIQKRVRDDNNPRGVRRGSFIRASDFYPATAIRTHVGDGPFLAARCLTQARVTGDASYLCVQPAARASDSHTRRKYLARPGSDSPAASHQ